MEMEILTVSQFQAILNQTLEFAYPAVVIEGEVSSFKVNQGKWVFFDLKDEECTVGCFMTVYNLKVPLEDGMLVRVVATPNLTKWGKFSLTVKSVELSGEGAVKKAFELLKAQFEKEGLFAPERKRQLPQFPTRIGLITSRQAAAFNDFVTVLNDRWSGLTIDQAQVQVQGLEAPRQISRAVEYFNDRAGDYDVLVIIRGGGSAEDLQAFSSEDVVRAVYGAKIPTLVGIGHEDDVSLAELAADLRAATPTDAARRLVPDKRQMIETINTKMHTFEQCMAAAISNVQARIERINQAFTRLYNDIATRINNLQMNNEHAITQHLFANSEKINLLGRVLAGLDPRAVLARGYSIATIDDKAITSASQIKADSRVMLQLYKGRVELMRPKGVKYAKSGNRKRRQKSKGQTEFGF